MILIADSGGTKTSWALVSAPGKWDQVETSGIQPFMMNAAQIRTVIQSELLPQVSGTTVKAVFFYGAGCSTEANCNLVEDVLVHIFRGAYCEVTTDLLGTARALCGDEPGIACILGTGSNSCYYDGVKIADQTHSLGYLLGDEGGGAYLGKMFIKEYLDNTLPERLKSRFERWYPELTFDKILDTVYRQPLPNRFLASFCPFIASCMDDTIIQQLVEANFIDFFDYHVMGYDHAMEVKAHFTGSIAYYFKETLIGVAEASGIEVGKIVQNPIEGLVAYHLAEAQ